MASNFVQSLKIAEAVFERYKEDQPKWWKRMDGTPILNDVAGRMAQAFQLPDGYDYRDLYEAQATIDHLEAKNAKLVAALKEIESGNMDRIWCALKAREVLKELEE